MDNNQRLLLECVSTVTDHDYETVLVFALGTASHGTEYGSLSKICDMMNQLFDGKLVLVLCIDNSLHDYGTYTATVENLVANNFAPKGTKNNAVPTIIPSLSVFEKTDKNIFKIILIDINLPCMSDNPYLQYFLAKCFEQKILESYFSYVVQHKQYINTEIQRYFLELYYTVNPGCVFIVNDLFYNTRGSVFQDKDGQFVNIVGIGITFNGDECPLDLQKVYKSYNFDAPTKPAIRGGICDSNRMFSEIPWIIYVLNIISVMVPTYIIDRGAHLYRECNECDFVCITFPDGKIISSL